MSSIDIKTLGLTATVGGVGANLLKEVRNKNPNELSNEGKSFRETLEQSQKNAHGPVAQTEVTNKPLLKFSNHALDRMNSRGITFSPEQITKIEQGMQRASSKGAKETLVLTEDSALIVSLKNNTVVTVMDKNMLKENVFTNIDSTVFV